MLKCKYLSVYSVFKSGMLKSFVKRKKMLRATIERKLTEALKPLSLKVLDDSLAHAGHAGVRNATSPETHFIVEIVSDAFKDLNLIKRHKLVYSILDEEMKAGLHALNISTKTPLEV